MRNDVINYSSVKLNNGFSIICGKLDHHGETLCGVSLAKVSSYPIRMAITCTSCIAKLNALQDKAHLDAELHRQAEQSDIEALSFSDLIDRFTDTGHNNHPRYDRRQLAAELDRRMDIMMGGRDD